MSRILVTGAAGFLGRRLLIELIARGQLEGQKIATITVADIHAPKIPEGGEIEITVEQGDLSDPAYLTHLSSQPFDTLFHLASFLTLEAEQDPERAFDVNVGALRHLIGTATHCPKVIFASSIAIHGGALPDEVKDDLNPVPTTTYGTHKAIIELLLADYTRLGKIDGRCLRLPIVLTRPGTPNRSVSDIIASILREPLSGQSVTVPVEPNTPVPIISAGAAVQALLKLHALPTELLPPKRAFNLPALTVTPNDMAVAVAAHGAHGAINFAPDPQVQAILNAWPKKFVSHAADQFGIAPDADLDALIDDYLEHKND